MVAAARLFHGPRAALALGGAAATALGLLAFGVVQAPDLEGALTDLSDTLGSWTYALVAGLAFLETGAFVGLVAPGETAIVLGGVVGSRGGSSSLAARGSASPASGLPAWTRSSTAMAPRRSWSAGSSASCARSP